MDFSNREVKPQTTAGSTPAAASSHRSSDKNKMNRVATVVAAVIVAVLLVGVIVSLASSDVKSESKYVDNNKLQAVFLNTGQVYFGNIKSLNSKYFVLSNIYYLQTANSGGSTAAANSSSNVTLVKLGCELHEPYDQMVINSTQVTFWENLQTNGQVAKAVTKFKTDNPQGQKCADQSSSSSSNSSNSVQSAGSNSSAPAASSSTTPSTTPVKP